MAEFDLATVGIFDSENYTDIIKEIIKNTEDDEPFFLLDIEDVVRKHKRWLEKMPRVVPYYAVKCNPDPTLIRLLAALNANFDCASKPEIQLVMKAGVSSDRIIYAHPGKARSHIRYAKKVGVERTTVDSKDEILKIKEAYPDAKLLIRLALDGSAEHCGVNFSQKFGCEPTTEAVELMEYMKEIKMTLLGFCFHLGSPCWDTDSYGRGIKTCSDLIDIAKTMGHSEAKVIDIGGGMDGKDIDYFDRLAASVNAALNDIDPSIEVISEPGRYYVETAFTLSACITGKKVVETDGDIKRFYYVNESTYGSFIEELLNLIQRIPISLYHKSDEKYPSRIWGRTADPYDVIIKNEMMQDFKVNDWMIWTNMGAYSLALASRFNGFQPAMVHPFIRKSALKYVSAEIKNS